jgi:hypothetical protein
MSVAALVAIAAFDFGASANLAEVFNPYGRIELVTPLLTKLLADNLGDQPDIGTLADDATQGGLLNNLIDDFIAGCDVDESFSQNNARVQSMVTAVCCSTLSGFVDLFESPLGSAAQMESLVTFEPLT